MKWNVAELSYNVMKMSTRKEKNLHWFRLQIGIAEINRYL